MLSSPYKRHRTPALESPEYRRIRPVLPLKRSTNRTTVRFTSPKAYAPFLGLTTLGILPSHLWQNISDEEFSFSTLETNPVGAGPFKVASVSRDSSGLIESVSFTENPQYVLGRPYLDGIRFVFYSSSENLTNALASGVVESAYDIPSARTLTAPYGRVFGVLLEPERESGLRSRGSAQGAFTRHQSTNYR